MSLFRKKPIFFLLLNFIVTSQLASLEPTIKEKNLWKTPAQILIESVPKEDRGHFVVYHLTEALNSNYHRFRTNAFPLPIEAPIPEEKYENFKSMTIYPDLSLDMLNWTKKTFNATDRDVHRLVTQYSAICPHFGCFDPNDIGQMCCPF